MKKSSKKIYFIISFSLIILLGITVVGYRMFFIPKEDAITYVLQAREANLYFDYKKADSFYRYAVRADSTNSNILEEYMLFSILQRDEKKAKQLAKEILKYNPSHFLANLVFITFTVKDGNLEKALDHLVVLKPEPDSLNDILFSILLSIKYYQDGDMKKFEDALAPIKVSLPELYYYEVFQLALLKDNNNAAKAALLTLNKQYMSIDTITLYSALLLREGHNPQAMENFKLYLDDHFLSESKIKDYLDNVNTKPNLYTLLSMVVYKLSSLMSSKVNPIYNSSDEVALLNIALMLNDNNQMARLGVANFYERIGDYNSAINMYNAVPENSYYARLAYPQVIEILKNLNKDKDAINQVDKYLKADPTNARLLLERGHLYHKEKQYKNAIESYTQALASSQKYNYNLGIWLSYYFRGVSNDKQGNWEAAEKDLLAAKNIDATDTLLVNYLAYSWITRGKNIQEALRMLKNSLKSNPKQANLLDSYSWGLFKTGKYKQALFYATKSSQIMPYDPIIIDHYGDILWQNGYKNEAKEQWKIASNLDSTGVLPKITDKINGNLPSYLKTRVKTKAKSFKKH